MFVTFLSFWRVAGRGRVLYRQNFSLTGYIPAHWSSDKYERSLYRICARIRTKSNWIHSEGRNISESLKKFNNKNYLSKKQLLHPRLLMTIREEVERRKEGKSRGHNTSRDMVMQEGGFSFGVSHRWDALFIFEVWIVLTSSRHLFISSWASFRVKMLRKMRTTSHRFAILNETPIKRKKKWFSGPATKA